MKVVEKYRYVGTLAFVFFSLSYFAVPYVLSLFSPENPQYKYNLFGFPAYTIIMVVLFVVYHREYLASYKYRPGWLQRSLFSWIALASFFTHFGFRYTLEYNVYNFPLLYGLAMFFYFLGIIFLALAIFGKELFQKTWRGLVAFGTVGFIFFVFHRLLTDLWDLVARLVARVVFVILKLFSETAFLDSTGKIGIGTFKVNVGAACSGLEGVSMFVGLFLLLLAYEGQDLNKRRTLGVFGIGLVAVFGLNILRVASLIAIGSKNPKFAMDTFHSNAGWLIFSLFMLGLIYTCYDWMKTRPHLE